MAKLSRDLGVGLLHPRENLFASGTLGSVGSEIIVNADGASTVALDLRGTFNLTVELTGSVDGANWTLIPVRPVNQSTVQYVAAVAGTFAGVWVGKCAPFRMVRARVTAYVSGAAAAVLMASTAVLDDSLQGLISPLLVTATGAAGAAVTLTLPAPGVGLRQYLTQLRVTRFAAAALTAAAAPVVVTSTNLPGSFAESLAADALAQGAKSTEVFEWALPLAAVAHNTATTIVCPATTNVIWRLTATYYVAP